MIAARAHDTASRGEKPAAELEVRAHPLRDQWPRVGRWVYASTSIALGLINLYFGDFAAAWQPLRPTVPHRAALAYGTALALALGGAATWRRRSARAGAVALGVVYFFFALLWLPRVIGFPQLAGTWLGMLEETTLVLAAIMVYAATAARSAAQMARTTTLCRVAFGLCTMSFGVAHFSALRETAAMVPAWLPPGQRFWAVVTGACHLLAALAMLSGMLALLATRLFTVMLLGFGALVWLPRLVSGPRGHMTWGGNAVNLAIAGAAWVLADALAAQGRARSLPSDRATTRIMPADSGPR
jgi:uncharacterized membrane protein